MKNLTFLKLFLTTMFVMTAAFFTSCVDDNDDTEAPYLKVSPTTLVFDTDSKPVEGSQSSFEISTNRHWTATVADDVTWVTLSKMEGDGSATIQVSIPEGITAEAKVLIQMSNKVGVLMTETVTIRSGNIVPATIIYRETVGTAAVSDNPAVNIYEGWDNKDVTYNGTNTNVRSSQSNTGAYEGASGPNNVFFAGAPAEFIINRIPLTAEQTTLKLTFGSIYVKDYDAKDYTFDISKFEVYLSGDGITWAPLTYTINNGDETKPNWVFATSNFTLKQAAANLYIKFRALESSKSRVDDITLSTGIGGTIIDLGSSEPSVFTTDASEISSTTATLGGSATNIDIATATEVGVQYVAFSTGNVADIDWSKATKVAATEKVTPWQVAVTNLTKDTQYAFRGYVKTATGELYGTPKTFTAKEPVYTSINIADLVSKMTAASTPVDNDYTIEGIICSDPSGLNYSYGTIFLMTQGATSAGNALSLYNNKINVAETYELGEKITVKLKKDVAKIYKRYDVPQVEGFTADDITSVSKNNAVNPVTVTVDQLAAFVCMPVTVNPVSIAEGGIWKEAGAQKNHTFTAGSTSFTVNINKQATPFDGQPFKAGNGPITGIASIFSSAGQLMPRNLKDVEAFKVTGPMIVDVDPSSLSFPAEGGNKTITVTTVSQGANKISATGLTETLSSSVSNNIVTIVATENSGTTKTQTLTISLENGNSVTVPVTQAAPSSGEIAEFTMTSQDFINGKTGSVTLESNKYGSQSVSDPSTWYTWSFVNKEFTGAKICIATEQNGGGIQVQGNASTVANQGRIANVTSLPNIQSIQIVLRVVKTSKNDPAYNVYAGTTANPSKDNTKIVGTSVVETGETFRTYTQTFDFSGGNYSYFSITNDLVGALYIDSIKIIYKN